VQHADGGASCSEHGGNVQHVDFAQQDVE